MNYMQYLNCDDSNGEGVRCTLFVAGCSCACKGCHNRESWNRKAGNPYTKVFEDQLINDLKSPYISGLSLSGGHPLEEYNYETVLNLCKRVKEETGKSVWLWTGYTYENIKHLEIFNYVDVVVDGKYVEELKCDHQYYGSSNQRVIEIEKGL